MKSLDGGQLANRIVTHQSESKSRTAPFRLALIVLSNTDRPFGGYQLGKRCQSCSKSHLEHHVPANCCSDDKESKPLPLHGTGHHCIGHSHAASMVITRPAMPCRDIIGDIVRSVSPSVMPDMRATTQKPASFIHGKGFEPQPMAMAK